MTTEAQPFSFSTNDLIKEAQRIKEFSGNGTYALSSFLREVDIILPLFNNQPLVKQYVFSRVIINKIQGQALDVIRTLGTDATWDVIKVELINNFGVRETYHQLYHQAISLRNFNVRNYFTSLRSILAKLNEKFEQDIKKPTAFAPKTNESIILRTFLDNLDPHLSSVILSRNITTLRDAFNILESSGLIKDRNIQHLKPSQNSFYKNKNYLSNQQPTYLSNQQPTFRQNSSQNFRQYNNSRNSNQFRNINYQANSNQIRSSPQNYRNNSEQTRRNQSQPMDVDYDNEANFQLMSTKTIYR